MLVWDGIYHACFLMVSGRTWLVLASSELVGVCGVQILRGCSSVEDVEVQVDVWLGIRLGLGGSLLALADTTDELLDDGVSV